MRWILHQAALKDHSNTLLQTARRPTAWSRINFVHIEMIWSIKYIIIVYFLKKTMLRHVSGFLLHQTSWAEFVKLELNFARTFVLLLNYSKMPSKSSIKVNNPNFIDKFVCKRMSIMLWSNKNMVSNWPT